MSVTSDLRILYNQVKEISDCTSIAIYDNSIIVRFFVSIDTKSIALLEEFMGLKGVVKSCNEGVCITFYDKGRD